MRRDIVHFLRTVKLRRCLGKSEVKVWECRNCGHIVVPEGGVCGMRASTELLSFRRKLLE